MPIHSSARPEDRPAIFAAQFALSHACWLITYPLAGWAGARLGLPVAALLLAGIAGIGIVAAMRVWPPHVEALPHDHPDLSPDHPHLADHGRSGRHEHAIVIDGLHPRWPNMR